MTGITPLLNKVHCMDALALMAQLPDESIDMVLTDFPYGEINHIDRLHSRAAYDGVLRNLHKGAADTVNFDLLSVLHELNRVTKGWIYAFCGTSQSGLIREYFGQRDCMTRHCIWEKTNPSPLHGQYTWLSSIENCIVARKRNAPFYEFCRTSVWRFAIEQKQQHPTQKPIDLFKYLVISSTKPGNIILDPFAGSGTTAVAAATLNRQFIAGDTDAGYCAIARKRLETVTQDMFAVYGGFEAQP